MAAKTTKPKYQTIGDMFVVQTEEQGELKIPLRFKTKLLRSLREKDGDELTQLFGLLDGIGDKDTAAKLDECDAFETMGIVAEFFVAFTTKASATKGE